ncbi:MAG: F0F1 ATP synthase subunit epsilon [Dehalococcoidia bacterium]|nr:F0F1 ATP synthase subunit epsilon [Dehalococcoidia bacterium]
MSTFRLEIVTAEKEVYADDVELLVAPGVEGELGILPHHAPLMTMLQPGELRIKKGGEEIIMCVSGGFLEVRPDKAIVLADTAERAEEIDIERAVAARCRAEEKIKGAKGTEAALIEAALRRSMVRIKVADRRRRRG